jgi:hypothetical protein
LAGEKEVLGPSAAFLTQILTWGLLNIMFFYYWIFPLIGYKELVTPQKNTLLIAVMKKAFPGSPDKHRVIGARP